MGAVHDQVHGPRTASPGSGLRERGERAPDGLRCRQAHTGGRAGGTGGPGGRASRDGDPAGRGRIQTATPGTCAGPGQMPNIAIVSPVLLTKNVRCGNLTTGERRSKATRLCVAFFVARKEVSNELQAAELEQCQDLH